MCFLAKSLFTLIDLCACALLWWRNHNLSIYCCRLLTLCLGSVVQISFVQSTCNHFALVDSLVMLSSVLVVEGRPILELSSLSTRPYMKCWKHVFFGRPFHLGPFCLCLFRLRHFSTLVLFGANSEPFDSLVIYSFLLFFCCFMQLLNRSVELL